MNCEDGSGSRHRMAQDLVLSDVHLELPGACRGLAHVTTFRFPRHEAPSSTPWQTDDTTVGPEVDEDGDLIMTRRQEGDGPSATAGGEASEDPRRNGGGEGAPSRMLEIGISHFGATALQDVGLQVCGRGTCVRWEGG